MEAVGKVYGLTRGQTSPKLVMNSGRTWGCHLQTQRGDPGMRGTGERGHFYMEVKR